MKKKHRKMHLVTWLILVPLLALVIFNAGQGRFDIEDEYAASDIPANGGRLP